MIRLFDLLNEMTARQKRVKKWRMVNESADVQIELTGKQVKELGTIFKQFGSKGIE